MENKWINTVPKIDATTAGMLTKTDTKYIMCLFDDGSILRYDEEHPFALMTAVLFLPEPPKN